MMKCKEIFLVFLAIIFMVVCCKERTTGSSKVKDYESTDSEIRGDVPDHNCIVVLRNIYFEDGPRASLVHFQADLSVPFLKKHPETQVFLRYVRVNNENPIWKDVSMSHWGPGDQPDIILKSDKSPDGYRSYGWYIPGAPKAEEQIHAIAYAKINGAQIFGHDFEDGDGGFVSVDQETKWSYEKGFDICNSSPGN